MADQNERGQLLSVHSMEDHKSDMESAAKSVDADSYQNTQAPQPDLEQVKAEKPAPAAPNGPPGGPPPNGGLTAWLQVLGGFFMFWNTWGLINAFGVFQTYYHGVLLPNKDNSQIAWIGTLTSFLLCGSPLAWGPIFDLIGPQILVCIGTFAVVFGIMMTSLCTEYWQLCLAQGIVCGIGGGSLFICSVGVLPPYFSTKRSAAIGIAASGSSFGGIIYPIIFHELNDRIGFGWTVRLIGFLALAMLSVSCAVCKPRFKKSPGGVRKIFDVAILTEVHFMVFNLATFFGFVGQYIPFFFIEQFAGEHGIGLAFWMLIFLNVGSIPGRTLPSLVADKSQKPAHVLVTTTIGAMILAFCWIAIRHSQAGLIVWCLLYGFCSGAFVSLQATVITSMTNNMATIGTRFGINMFSAALGILIGSPVGGAIFPSSWPGAQSFCGATLAASVVCIIAAYFLHQRSLKKGV
ncbi:hypothetical protein R9X50_00292700 [Acrodontium crateriforme]|uniref:Major facilitator superfamily (MFS) profile domain-containing protein n=1 Tax=Acrodontium crateriforme TaxID=150365 RepID=A0AAQ3R723_9PEZI|nr:hypothetical protein R9X50_00292700 [Acrodontium crateriforme]